MVLLQRIVPHHLISRIVGWVANSRISWIKNIFIRTIIKRYQVDTSEALKQDIHAYDTFNDFFTRQLKPEARPVGGRFCSPADGSVSAAGDITCGQLIQAKGIDYSLQKLLGRDDVSDFQQGSFITIYLSPRDYHRVHCPANAELYRARYVPGRLFSVNQATTDGVKDLFAVNERLVMDFNTGSGKMTVVMVGAMIVAAIKPAWRLKPYQARIAIEETFSPTKTFEIGEELGLFQMGSTAIVLLQERVNWLRTASTSVRMGEAIVV